MNMRISTLHNIAETFRCTYCNAEVEEDASALPKHDARTLLAKFNEQIEPIFVLLRETEDIVLPYDLLEPQPTEIPELSERYKCNPRASDQYKTPQRLSSCKIFEILILQPAFCFVQYWQLLNEEACSYLRLSKLLVHIYTFIFAAFFFCFEE